MLWLLARRRPRAGTEAGWRSALALLFYAAPFSWAYLSVGAGVGALLLFGSVQTTMFAAALAHGERPSALVWAGLIVALCGLAGLTLPGALFLATGRLAAAIAAHAGYNALAILRADR